MASVNKVALVGHCGADSAMLQGTLKRVAKDAEVLSVASAEQLEKMGPDTLLLVNRALGWGFGVKNGVELIRQLGQRDDGPRLMLISNFDDAQREAEEAGALPGFGKAEAHSEQAAERLRAALA